MAAGAGLLLTAAFPGIGLAGMAWLAPGLMIAAAFGRHRGEVFRLGYIAGLAHYLSMLYWLLFIPYRWNGIPIGPAAGWLALSSFLALFPAFWVWLVCPPVEKLDQAPPGFGALARTWTGRCLWAAGGATAWVATEMVLARLLGGFPWDLLGVSQYRLTPLIQLASITGVYGISFLVVWISLSLLSAGLMIIRKPTTRSVWMVELFLPLLVIGVVFHIGLRRLLRPEPPSRATRFVLVQPSIPQTLIWNPDNDDRRFQDLLQLTEQALAQPADVLIWPESAIPKMIRASGGTLHAVSELARRHHVWMIIGSDDAEPARNPVRPGDADYFNACFLVSPDGKLVDRYIKRNLVIFGEYVPLQEWLPFLRHLTPIQGGFTAGEQSVLFELSDLNLIAAPLICFEDIFPQLARSDARAGVDFLVNLTNDGWFGHSSAQWQHAATALFRAVENGVPLIRCSNNGLTCWIDSRGRLRDILKDVSGTVYGPGFLSVSVPAPDPDNRRGATFYGRHGDWFGWATVVTTGLMLVQRLLSGRWRHAIPAPTAPPPNRSR